MLVQVVFPKYCQSFANCWNILGRAWIWKLHVRTSFCNSFISIFFWERTNKFLLIFQSISGKLFFRISCFILSSSYTFLNFSKIHRQTPVSDSLKACNFIEKETLRQGLSCEFCESFKNIFLQNTSRWPTLNVSIFSEFWDIFSK